MAKEETKKADAEEKEAPKKSGSKLRFDVKHDGKHYAKGSEAPAEHVAHFKKEGYLE